MVRNIASTEWMNWCVVRNDAYMYLMTHMKGEQFVFLFYVSALIIKQFFLLTFLERQRERERERERESSKNTLMTNLKIMFSNLFSFFFQFLYICFLTVEKHHSVWLTLLLRKLYWVWFVLFLKVPAQVCFDVETVAFVWIRRDSVMGFPTVLTATTNSCVMSHFRKNVNVMVSRAFVDICRTQVLSSFQKNFDTLKWVKTIFNMDCQL